MPMLATGAMKKAINKDEQTPRTVMVSSLLIKLKI